MFIEPTEAVTISDMLQCRDRRVLQQQRLVQQGVDTKKPFAILSFCMNVPGPIKSSREIKKAFTAGKGEIYSKLLEKNIHILAKDEYHGKTGDELLLLVATSPPTLKTLTVSIEVSHIWGRLFDMDVLNQHGHKLSRPRFRTCFICSMQAQECARSRKHSVSELQEKIKALLILN